MQRPLPRAAIWQIADVLFMALALGLVPTAALTEAPKPIAGTVPLTIEDVAGKMEGQTICAFADAAAWPVQGLLRHFRDDFTEHVRQRKCPFPGSFEL